MKRSQPQKPPRPDPTGPQAYAEPSPWIELDADTITDAMVRTLLSETSDEHRTDLRAACCKALLPPRSARDAAERRAALWKCASEINHRAAIWRRFYSMQPLRYSKYEKFAQLLMPLNATQPRCIDMHVSHMPVYPLCWDCCQTLGDKPYELVLTDSGQIVMHSECMSRALDPSADFYGQAADTLELDETDY